MKKILVLMATYNGEQYLEEQIQSLLDQQNVSVSILVRDDGSTDGTVSLLQHYQEKGTLQWYTGEHLNVQWGFWDLMKKAANINADYYAFCDQDDVWDLDKLSVAEQHLSLFPADVPALYYCGQRLVDKDLKFLSDHVLNESRSLTTRFVLSDFAGCTGVFNKALLHEVIQYKPTYLLMHDTWILKVCLALGGQVVVDPKPHMNYRQHGKNTVGLQKSVRGYAKQVMQYLNEYKVEPQMQELLRGYGERMVPQYREIAQWVCGYQKNRAYKRKLLEYTVVNFCNKGLNITYALKILLNKL